MKTSVKILAAWIALAGLMLPATTASAENVTFPGNTSLQTVTVDGSIYNNAVAPANAVNDNHVTVYNTSGAVPDFVFGGYNTSGASTGNTTILNSGATVNLYVYGGFATSTGNATGNTVTLNSGASASTVYGGWTSGMGSSSGNTVIINTGATVNSVYGGYLKNDNGFTAKNNTVILHAGVTVGVDVYGGNRSSVSNPISTGNKLELIGSGQHVKRDLNGFQYLSFSLPSTLSDGSTVLTVGQIAGSTADITDATVSIDGSGLSLSMGNTVVLIDASAGTLTGTPANNTVSSGGYSWSLSVVDKKLIATVTGVVPVAPTITTATLPSSTVGAAYSQTLAATGTAPITWSVASGALPGGLSLSTDGVISGTPTAGGSFTFTLSAANGGGSDTKAYTVAIAGGEIITHPGNAWVQTVEVGLRNFTNAVAPSDKSNGNWVTVNASLLHYPPVTVLGGYNTNGPSTGNTATINRQVDYAVFGGYATNGGSATGNTVILNSGASVNHIYGGMTENNGSSSNNTVIVHAGVSVEDVYGGYLYDNVGIAANNNTVTLHSGVTVEEDVCVGSKMGNPTVGTGNKLELIGSGQNVGGNLRGFQQLSFSLPSPLSDGGTVLTVGGTAVIAGVTVSIDGSGLSLSVGNTVVLIDASAGTLTGTQANPAVSGGGYYWSLSVVEKKLIATVTGIVPVAPEITTTTLSNGAVGAAYSQTLAATGTTPIIWSIPSGALPSGLALSSDGVISGTPTAGGTFNFTLRAGNEGGSDTEEVTLAIAGGEIIIYPGVLLQPVAVGTGSYFNAVAPAGAANFNRVTVNDVSGDITPHFVFGGYNTTGASIGNTTTLNSGATVSSSVYGGFATGEGGATGNTVMLHSGVTVGEDLFGGSRSGLPIGTGNKLELIGSGQHVGRDLKGFQQLSFSLPSTLSNGGTVLTVGGTADVTGATVSIDASGLSLSAGNTVVLIAATGAGTLIGAPANITVGGGGYQWNLSVSGNKLIATVQGTAPVAPTMTTTTLSDGTVSATYNQTLAATSTAPVTWSRTSGALPNGLALSSDGMISGTPTAGGTFTFTLRAENAGGSDTKDFTVTIFPKGSPAAGETVYFGAYEQANNGAPGEPIAWRVLDRKDGKLFLLSEKNLDAKPYHGDNEVVTWETSTMRSWLNGYDASFNIGGASGIDYSGTGASFINTAFTLVEREAIATTLVVNDDNLVHNIAGGNDTNDKIFLLSIAEVTNTAYGFTNDAARVAVNTAYVASLTGMNPENSANYWWLRSPGSSANYAAYVLATGGVSYAGYYVYYTAAAARPALHLNMDAVVFKSESGKNFAIPKLSVSHPTITTESLSDCKVGVAYSQQLEGTTESGYELTWSVASGNLPTGLALAPNGTIAGTPTVTGSFTFGVKAANAAWGVVKEYTVAILPEGAPAAGETIYFGAYEQANNDAPGEPIAWRVLDRKDGKLFLLSEKNLDVKPYHVDSESVTWEKSGIRSWLNGYPASFNIDGGSSGIDYSGAGASFINTAFTEAERGSIATTLVVNGDNPVHNIAGGNDTNDKIFLLSIAEVTNTAYGFINAAARVAVNTKYVASLIYMNPEGSADKWWLRSPGSSANRAASVTLDGQMYYDYFVSYLYAAARPALHLNLDAVFFKAESGKNFAIPTSSVSHPTITTASLPSGMIGVAYNQQLVGTTDSGYDLTWSVVSGNLPTGLAFAPDGTIDGTPTATGRFTFEVKAANDAWDVVKTYTVEILTEGMPVTGGTVYFGAYEQANDGGDGEPIAWRVLDRQDGKLFLLSEKNLDAKLYHEDNESNVVVTWEKSTIRSWLNGYDASFNIGGTSGKDYSGEGASFINTAFTEAEREAIATTFVVNEDNLEHDVEGGNDTNDKIFLLSVAEVTNTAYGFTEYNYATPTRVAVNTAYVASLHNDRAPAGSADSWWLRSRGSSDEAASRVLSTGQVRSVGDYGYNPIAADRPALNLNLDSVCFQAESENVYSVIPKSLVSKPTITTASLPSGKVGVAYSQQLAGTTDSRFALTWSVASGNLPTGLAFAPNGTIAGTPTAAGSFTFEVKAANDAWDVVKTYTVAIAGDPETITYPGGVSLQDVTIASGSYPNAVAPSYAANSNQVTVNDVSAATVPDYVFGGYNTSGASTGNTTILNSGATVNAFVYGGFATDGGNATSNTVTLNSGASTNNVFGGWTDGTGSSSSNTVTVNTGATVNGNVFGGSATNGGDATDNTVTLHSGASTSNVFGGRTDGTGSSSGNTVTVSTNATVNENVYGGFATNGGDATGNTVTISSGASTNNVFGGRTEGTGSASGNTVIIDTGATVDANVYGGYLNSGDGVTADNNTVILHSGVTVGLGVYGGIRSGNTAVGTGNKLDLRGSGQHVGGDLKGFQQLSFSLPSTLSNGGTVLTVNGAADITGATVSIGGSGLSLIEGNTVVLIDASAGGTLTGDPAISTVSGGGYYWSLSVSGNKLMATVTGIAPVAPTITTPILPNGTMGAAYSQTLAATGATPITWRIASGTLPSGLALSSDVISGTPTAGGTFTFIVEAANAGGSDTKAFTVTIASGGTDITAEFVDLNFLACVRTALGKGATDNIYDTDNFASVTSLDVSGKSIANLAGIERFTALTTLTCGNNQLTTLPTLPATLTDLSCNGNQLTALPTLPATLTVLSCDNNQLTALPTLPATLTALSCGDNRLSVLPTLPTTLTNLICNSNQLTALPTLPAGLTTLHCNNNQLTGTLDVSGLSLLTTLNSANNRLTGVALYSGTSWTSLDVRYNYMTATEAVTGFTGTWGASSAYFSPQHASGFKAVTAINGLPNTAVINVPLTLSGTVFPADATNQIIVWSITNAGTTGATLSSGNILTAVASGTVTMKAQIADGQASGVDYNQGFDVAVLTTPPPALTYTVTFDGNGGAPASWTKTVTSPPATTVDALPSDPTWTGYTFAGWNTSADGSGAAFTATTPVTGDVTVYAQWTAAVHAQTPTITAHPQPATYTTGATATALSVTATVTDGGTLSYQWYGNTTDSNTDGTPITGATGAAYTPPTATVGTTYYYVVVTNTNSNVNGAQMATAASNTAAVNVSGTSTGVGETLKADISAYPNPFRGSLHLTGAEGCTLTVFTSTGALVHTQKLTAADETIYLEHLPTGLYLFRLEKDGKTKTLKIVNRE